MTTPTRIQRRRTAGSRLPAGAIYVGRPTRWANPFAIRRITTRTTGGTATTWTIVDTLNQATGFNHAPPNLPDQFAAQVMAVRLFELHTGPMGSYRYSDDDLRDLRERLGGKTLACWCPVVDELGMRVSCHADHLLRLANPGIVLPGDDDDEV